MILPHYQNCEVLLSLYCLLLSLFWGWLVLLFVLNTSSTLWQDQSTLEYVYLLLWEHLFGFLQTSVQGYCPLLDVSLAVLSLDIFQWLNGSLTWPLGSSFILFCVCTHCIIPDKICVAWEGLKFQFMLWYMEIISVPFKMSDYVEMVQLTYKLNSDRDMQKKAKVEVFVGKQSHTGLHVSLLE